MATFNTQFSLQIFFFEYIVQSTDFFFPTVPGEGHQILSQLFSFLLSFLPSSSPMFIANVHRQSHCQPSSPIILAGNGSQCIPLVIFPCSYSLRHIPLLLFPSTCMLNHPNKTTQVRILNFGLMNSPICFGLHFLCWQLSQRNVLQTSHNFIRVTLSDITSPTSTCEYPGLQCDSLNDRHKSLSRWNVQKSFQNCSAITFRILPLSYSSLSSKTTVRLLHTN